MNALLQPGHRRRVMTVRDLDAVMAIEAQAYGHPWTRGNFIDSLAASYLAEVLESSQQGVFGYYMAMPGVDELHLLNITVAPACQGRGWGSLLLDAVQQQARELGLSTLWLEVRQSNPRAQALYQRRGFVAVGLRRGYYPAGQAREDAVVMRLGLVDSGPDDGLD